MQTKSWQERLGAVHEMMHEMSRQTDPQEMVRAYGRRVRELIARDRNISLSRRGLEYPQYRVTRFSEWAEDINPWREKHRLPLLSGGLLADLIYGNRPQLLERLELADEDPARPYLEGQQSLIAIPMFDDGQALNMVISSRNVPGGFDPEQFPEIFWMASLFGRATHNLVLKSEVQQAFQAVDHELKVVSNIQRSLLPKQMPDIPHMQLATHYETSQRAGGDYYDFFPLADGRWGILIADVSGHGTPAAVVMAVTHSIAHLFPGEVGQPCELLDFVNQHLSARYTGSFDAFVTAFYAVFDPVTRHLTYANAGHNPPRIWRCGSAQAVDLPLESNLPLGCFEEVRYSQQAIRLQAGDRLILYTDGITEAMSATGEQFGLQRLDQQISACHVTDARAIRDRVVAQVRKHADGAPISDDRTLIVAVVN